MKKPRAQPVNDNVPVRLGIDTGSGRWFVFERTGGDFRLIAGPFQTIAAVERLIELYVSGRRRCDYQRPLRR
jgi:hypothetical protein